MSSFRGIPKEIRAERAVATGLAEGARASEPVDTRLPPLSPYYGRSIVDGYGLIHNKRTSIILDVIRLAGDIMR